ncbi:MAG: hypothetical protein JKY56_12275, partial [Kofleriaceae bacterium]|nr:hypothetical protein [Kofleriaceae bacterium]
MKFKYGAIPLVVLFVWTTACTVGDRTPRPELNFLTDIVPIIERDCGTSVCHAASDEQFAGLPASYYAFPVDSDGKITGSDRLEAARARTLEKLASEDVKFSELIRKPLDESLGGLAHRGGTQYGSMASPDLI